MPWGAVAGAVIGGASSALSSNSASNKQQSAANAALQEQQREYDTTRNDNAPALAARNSGLAGMQSLASSYQATPTADQVMATPGYQFGLNQGLGALNSNAAATGGLYSGEALKAAATYGNNYATTKYQQAFGNLQSSQDAAFNRQASLAGQGQVGTNAINTAGLNTANNSSGIDLGLGNVLGANSIANGNAWGKMGSQLGNVNWGQLGNQVSSWFTPSMYTNGSEGGVTNGIGMMADGGPVQLDANGVPVIGSKSPVKTGNGGGLSTNALIALLQQPQVPTTTPQPLPANPLTDPAAILAARMKAAGAYSTGGEVVGPGGPRSDVIPAMLSNGEHVIDAASVNAIGGGNNAVGQAKLNKLRLILQGAK